MSVEAPKGLSLAARRQWYEQTGALEEAGRLTAARVELVTAWCRAGDARTRALEAWQAAGSPQSETGSMGQARRHHLAIALEKAEVQLATMAGKVERSAARKDAKRQDGLPAGARRIGDGDDAVVVDVDGRLLMRSVMDGQWKLDLDERDAEAGALVRWVDAEGVPQFHAVPPWRMPGDGGRAQPLPWDEVEVWCGRVGVPVEAAREWYGRDRRAPSRITYRAGTTLDDMLG